MLEVGLSSANTTKKLGVNGEARIFPPYYKNTTLLLEGQQRVLTLLSPRFDMGKLRCKFCWNSSLCGSIMDTSWTTGDVSSVKYISGVLGVATLSILCVYIGLAAHKDNHP
jgi:hypothetical protein